MNRVFFNTGSCFRGVRGDLVVASVTSEDQGCSDDGGDFAWLNENAHLFFDPDCGLNLRRYFKMLKI